MRFMFIVLVLALAFCGVVGCTTGTSIAIEQTLLNFDQQMLVAEQASLADLQAKLAKDTAAGDTVAAMIDQLAITELQSVVIPNTMQQIAGHQAKIKALQGATTQP